MKTQDPAPAVAPVVRCRPSAAVEPLEARQLLSSVTTVTVTTHKAQTIDGFGTSLGGSTSTALLNTKAFQKAYYQDLGASMFRVALNPWLLRGKTKSGKTSLGVAVPLGRDLNRNIKLFDFDNGNIKKYGTMARAALKYGSEVKIIGSVWSPPYWMKGAEVSSYDGRKTDVRPTYDDSTGNTSGGSLVDTDANLTQFGRYVAAYVAGFQKAYGVPMYAVSIQNELAFHESYSSAVYSPRLYVDALKAVKHWFDIYHIKTKLIGPEDVGVGSVTNQGLLSRQMAYVKALRSSGAIKLLDGFAIHGYAADGRGAGQRSPQMWAEYLNGYQGSGSYMSWDGIAGDDKSSWQTEASGYSSAWSSTMNLAGAIQDSIVYGNASAYVYWGISNTSPSGEALTSGTNYQANKYEAFKHFSAFVRPGARRLTTKGGDPDGVYVSAYADDAKRTLTSVVLNESDKTQTLRLKLGGIRLSQFDVGYVSTEKKVWRKVGPVKVKNGVAEIELPADSIWTLVGKVTHKVAPGGISGNYFNDANRNGKHDATERGLGGDKIYLDLNRNNVRDANEPYAVTDAKGNFAFTGVQPGEYRVRRDVPDGWMWTTPRPTVTVVSGKTTRGVSLGVAKAPTTPTPKPTPTPGKTASIAGHAFNDTDGDGRQDAGESDAVGKAVFLDADNDGTPDSGEKRVKTDARGDFVFTGLAAGTYHVRRVYSNGYTASIPTAVIALTAGQKKTGVLIGSKAK